MVLRNAFLIDAIMGHLQLKKKRKKHMHLQLTLARLSASSFKVIIKFIWFAYSLVSCVSTLNILIRENCLYAQTAVLNIINWVLIKGKAHNGILGPQVTDSLESSSFYLGLIALILLLCIGYIYLPFLRWF